MQLKMGGKFHLRLNTGKRPIANKYREGKMKRTLKRELKVREIVKREAIEASIVGACSASSACGGVGWNSFTAGQPVLRQCVRGVHSRVDESAPVCGRPDMAAGKVESAFGLTNL